MFPRYEEPCLLKSRSRACANFLRTIYSLLRSLKTWRKRPRLLARLEMKVAEKSGIEEKVTTDDCR
jgi:hypothetical protein